MAKRRLRNAQKKPYIQNVFYGLNLRGRDDDLYLYEATQADNVVFVRGNKPQTRPGRLKVNSAVIPDGVKSMAIYNPSFEGETLFLDSGSGRICKDERMDGDWIYSRTNASNEPFKSVNMNDQLFRTNGTDVIRWDGTQWKDWFQSGAAGLTCSVMINGAGVLHGVYAYKFTYYVEETIGTTNWYLESKPSLMSSELTVANNTIRVSGITRPGDYWDGVRLYRKGGNNPEWQLVESWGKHSLPIYYDDNTADDALGATLASDGYAPPPKGKLLAEKNGYIFISGINENQSRVAWNKAKMPHYFPDEDFSKPHLIDVEPGDGEPITAIYPYLDGLFVFKESKTYYMPVTTPPYEMQVKRISKQYGCISSDSVVEMDDGLYFQGREGIMKFDPGRGEIERVSWQVDIDEQGGMNETPIYYRRKAVAVYVEVHNALWISYIDKDTGTHDKIWVYNRTIPNMLAVANEEGDQEFKKVSRWSKHTFGFACYVESKNDDLLITGDEDGYYWKEMSSHDDDGTPILTEYYTSWRPYQDFSFNGRNITSRQLADTYIHLYIADSDVTVTTGVDFGVRTDTFTIPHEEGAEFGTGIYGVDVWGEGEGWKTRITPMPQDMVGEYFRVGVSGYNFALSKIGHVVRRRTRRYE